MDTDSLIYCGTIETIAKSLISFNCGNELGQFKREYDNIIEFQALAPKMYKIKLSTDEIIRKVKGAS